jgi:hypothetical protein
MLSLFIIIYFNSCMLASTARICMWVNKATIAACIVTDVLCMRKGSSHYRHITMPSISLPQTSATGRVRCNVVTFNV